MTNTFINGFSTFFKAPSFVSKHGLWYFYLFPLALSIGFFLLSNSFRDDMSLVLNDLVFNKLFQSSTLHHDSIWYKILVSSISVVVWIITIYLWVKINRYVALIFLSPVFSILSEKVEEKMLGTHYPFSLKQLWRDVWRGAFIAIRNLFLEISILGTCFLLGLFFPFIGFFTALCASLVSWYFMGFSFLDYNFERHKMSKYESYKGVWDKKGVALVHGMLFTWLAYVPVIGLMFGSIWATVGSTIAVCEENALDSKK